MVLEEVSRQTSGVTVPGDFERGIPLYFSPEIYNRSKMITIESLHDCFP